MKKKKLVLRELKIKSFVTFEDGDSSKTIKGGIANPIDHITKDPIKTKIGCGPTPGTWCYVCPADY